MSRSLVGLAAVMTLASVACDSRVPNSAAASGRPAEVDPHEEQLQPETPKQLERDGDSASESEKDDGTLVPDPITHPCVVKAAQFDVALEEASDECNTDADCDCYPGGVSRKAGCGGVTSATAAKELHRLAAEFRNDGCRLAQDCAARACEPKCAGGHCE